MPIETAIEQAAIADTLIGDPHSGTDLGTIDELFERAEEVNTADENGLYPEDYADGAQPLPDYERESQESQERDATAEQAVQELDSDLRDEQAQQLADEQQTQEPTQESVSTTLDEAVNDLRLNDPVVGTEFANELCQMGGVSLAESGCDVRALQQTMSKVTLSAANLLESYGGDLSQAPSIPTQDAHKFTADYFGSWGADPQSAAQLAGAVDSGRFAATHFVGAHDILRTWWESGCNPDVTQWTDPAKAIADVESAVRALGISGPLDPVGLLNIAYSYSRNVINTAGKIYQAQQQQAPRSSGRRRSASPRMESNQDIFGDDAMEIYHSRHGRL